LNPQAAGLTGKYFDDQTPVKSSPLSYDVDKQEDLWKWTVKNTVGGDDGLEGLKN
jgi:hypothetical protein